MVEVLNLDFYCEFINNDNSDYAMRNQSKNHTLNWLAKWFSKKNTHTHIRSSAQVAQITATNEDKCI